MAVFKHTVSIHVEEEVFVEINESADLVESPALIAEGIFQDWLKERLYQAECGGVASVEIKTLKEF